jgi:hypothetical protein
MAQIELPHGFKLVVKALTVNRLVAKTRFLISLRNHESSALLTVKARFAYLAEVIVFLAEPITHSALLSFATVDL